MRPTTRRDLVTGTPTGISKIIPVGTFGLIEQIYEKRGVRYSTVKKALKGIDRAILTAKGIDRRKTERLLQQFKDFTETVESDSGRVKVLNHIFVGSILKSVENTGEFSKQEYMRWARARFGCGHTDQTLLNSRYIADLGDIAFTYADSGVKSVLELHYMFNSFLKQKLEEEGEANKRKPTKAERNKYIAVFKSRLDEFLSIYSMYDSRDQQLTMRTSMDAAITYYRLTEEAGISEAIVTKDHAIMIALFKGFSLENKDAIALGKHLKDDYPNDTDRAVVFDNWVANRMANAPMTFAEMEHGQNPARILELLSRLVVIPDRGIRHLTREINELKKESLLTKLSVRMAHEIIVYLSKKLHLGLDDERSAYENFVLRMKYCCR